MHTQLAKLLICSDTDKRRFDRRRSCHFTIYSSSAHRQKTVSLPINPMIVIQLQSIDMELRVTAIECEIFLWHRPWWWSRVVYGEEKQSMCAFYYGQEETIELGRFSAVSWNNKKSHTLTWPRRSHDLIPNSIPVPPLGYRTYTGGPKGST